MSTVVCFVIAAAVTAIAAYRVGDPVGWWLFRVAHRDNPEALAFADRKQGRTPTENTPKQEQP
jgi:hypothetical protein